ncbi:MAG: porin family protein [Bacteroidia bacterium]|nr:PorT family protein [Bacteroidia bacterium]MDW8014608.1 porin family protein [Bacteroidia bacterium]
MCLSRNLLLFGALLWAQNRRQWQIGPQVGLNIPAYRSSQPVDKAVVLPGFTGGFQVRYKLAPRWALQGGLYFSQRTSAYLIRETYADDTTIGTLRDEYIVHILNDGRLQLAHIELPVLVEWSFFLREHSRSYFLLGTHGGYCVFSRNSGETQVALQGLDFLPLFGFPPSARLIVAEGPIEEGRVEFRRRDWGFWFGGGSAYQMGRGEMSFEIRTAWGLINIFRKPTDQRFYNGSIMIMTGYLF